MNTQLSIDFNTKAHSYHNITDKGTKQSIVLSAFSHLRKASDKDVADYLGWAINCVIPRRSELMEMNLIRVAGIKTGLSGKPNKTYEVNK